MFWITRDQLGERGRLYYSPIGRPESVAGFIEVTSDDDPLQRLVTWEGIIGVASESKVYQIIGTLPYIAREVAGIAGTTAPFTIALSPYGIPYESADGVRLYTGNEGKLIAYDAISRVFRGESVENLTSFAGIVGTYARGEYIISDGTQTLALDLEKLKWRDLGIGCHALFYSAEADIIGASIDGAIIDLEKEGETDDNNIAISFSLKPPIIRADRERLFLIKRALIDADTNGEILSIEASFDNSTLSLDNLSTSSSRVVNELEIDRLAERGGITITGSLSTQIEIFNVSYVVQEIVLIVNLMGTNQSFSIPGRRVDDLQSIKFDFEIEPASPLLTPRKSIRIERFYFDIRTEGAVTPVYEFVDRDETFGSINHTSRSINEQAINRNGRLKQFRLDGDFSGSATIYRLELDIHIPKGDNI